MQRTAALRAVEAQNLSTLRLAALSQAQIIANTKGLFSTLIVASEIRSRNVDGCNVLLDYILQTSTEYRGFAISSLEGKTWCATANLRASLINTTTASPPRWGERYAVPARAGPKRICGGRLCDRQRIGAT
ncbi:MAG: hypothetical protein HC853_07625 [Anaerolineae bacterium]|nr:hypothetical protein [Anaerolineae bacterium]